MGKILHLASSEEFRADWIEFLQTSIGMGACAILYQFVTKAILEVIIKLQFTVLSTPVTVEVAELDYDESNALRYCAGYILRSAKKKIEKSAHSMKKSLLLCVEDLFESQLIMHDGNFQLFIYCFFFYFLYGRMFG